MNFFDSNQFYVFITAIIIGFALGLYYDFYKLKRKFLPFGKIQLFIDDLLFTQTSCIIIIVYVFMANNGIYRWYEFISVVLGFMLYRVTLSGVVLFVLSKTVAAVRWLILKLIYPVKFVVNILYKFGLSLLVCIRKVYSVFFKRISCEFYKRKIIKDAKRGFLLLPRR